MVRLNSTLADNRVCRKREIGLFKKNYSRTYFTCVTNHPRYDGVGM